MPKLASRNAGTCGVERSLENLEVVFGVTLLADQVAVPRPLQLGVDRGPVDPQVVLRVLRFRLSKQTGVYFGRLFEVLQSVVLGR